MTITVLPGQPVSTTDGRTDTTFLDDNTPVPGTAVFVQGRAFTQGGSAYICRQPAGGTAPQGIQFIQGAAVRSDGAQITLLSGTPTQFLRGVGYTGLGELCADTNAPVQYPNGIGCSGAGLASVSAIS